MQYKERHFEELTSTNDFAMQNLDGFENGTVISASTQTDGHGRFERKWLSKNSENLYATIVLKPTKKMEELSYLSNLTQYMSVVLCEVLEGYGLEPQIKWPNDVLVGGKKIAGILAKTAVNGETLKGFVLGIGVNLNLTAKDIEQIDQAATSLNLETGGEIDKKEFSNRLFSKFFDELETFETKGFELIKNRYVKKCFFIGNEIEIKNINNVQRGVARKINDDGSLLFENTKEGKNETVRIGDLMVC